MNHHYDNMDQLACQTKIKEVKNGYYSFEDTVFYGEKGGQLADKGTINGLPVLDLKWEGDTLYHKVEGSLSNPIEMEVDQKTRWINASVQTVFHLLDGFYENKGLKVTAVHANPDHQWYELDSKDVSDQLLRETEAFIQEVIAKDIKVEFLYTKGSEYPDKSYQHYDCVRVVKIGAINSQPCGTCHVNRTGQIGTFVILGKEKTSKGAKISIAVHQAASERLKQLYHQTEEIARLMSTDPEETVQKLKQFLTMAKEQKQTIKTLKANVANLQAQLILKEKENVLSVDTEDSSILGLIARELLRASSKEYALYAERDGTVYFAFASPAGKAAVYFEHLKVHFKSAAGGGSQKILTGKIDNIHSDHLKYLLEGLLG